MQELLPALTVTVSIDCSPDVVYDYVADVANLPEWSFFASARPSGEDWLVGTQHGEVRLRMTARNDLGVLDHWVADGPDRVIHVPMRVVANGGGSAVTLTVFEMPGTEDDQHAADVAQVEHDLARLRSILESR